MFNAQEAANKFQDIFKNPEKVKSPPKPESKASLSGKLVQKSSSPNFAMPPKNEVKQGRVGAVKSVSPPAAKSSSQAT
uniref:Uncharacterized protein n=1 Tax=Ciona savignyi TaxID=51511 RepID=H2Z770_CIOSA